jgi:mRNA-degrading endonuclease RelE of RelBE toxin-antitoxin system
MYAEKFDEDWEDYFKELDNKVKIIVVKKINKILEYPYKRHLGKGARFFVSEAGQYRIVYRVFYENCEVRFYFVGDHKEYESGTNNSFKFLNYY